MTVQLPKAFQFLFKPSRYKGAYGGRGSAKSHSFASALVIKAASQPLRVLCCREIQRSIKDSSKRLIDDKIQEFGLGAFFESTETEIRGKNGSLFLFAGLKTNPEAIKSMEGIDIAWVEEANRVSRRSLDLLVPTIRKENSEIWFSWNPESEMDPVDIMFRGPHVPPNALVHKVNYTENPFFPKVLEQEMEFDKQTDPEKYNHVWLGGYLQIKQGAYYARALAKAANEGRITRVPYDPKLPVYASFDLGIGDATGVWLYQIVVGELHYLEYFESSGEGIEWYARQLRSKPYTYSPLVLPHDARARQLGTGKSIEEVLRALNFETTICPNIPVKDGIEETRRVIERAYFDDEGCKEGLRMLREYHENFDEKTRLSRGPLHDYTSHCADALRYSAVSMQTIKPDLHAYEQAVANLNTITARPKDNMFKADDWARYQREALDLLK